jgi:hypothetical protein
MTLGWIIFGLLAWAFLQVPVLALFGLAREPEADDLRVAHANHNCAASAIDHAL